MPNKTDRNDVRALAQIIRTGCFRQVHMKSPTMPVVARRTVLKAMRSARHADQLVGRLYFYEIAGRLALGCLSCVAAR